MKNKYINCPVCDDKRLRHTIRNHISQTAQREVYKNYLSKGKSTIPHQKYIEKNSVVIKTQTYKIKD